MALFLSLILYWKCIHSRSKVGQKSRKPYIWGGREGCEARRGWRGQPHTVARRHGEKRGRVWRVLLWGEHVAGRRRAAAAQPLEPEGDDGVRPRLEAPDDRRAQADERQAERHWVARLREQHKTASEREQPDGDAGAGTEAVQSRSKPAAVTVDGACNLNPAGRSRSLADTS